MIEDMPVNYFKVLQNVLSQTRDVICKEYSMTDQQAFQASEDFIRENSLKWRLTDPAIQYSNPFCRMAYLYMNVAIHAALVEHALDTFREFTLLCKHRIALGQEIRICALGGGPGSELLGLVRFLEKLKLSQPAYIDFTLIDRIKEWDESWHALKQGIDHHMFEEHGLNRSRWPAVISRSFLPLDVTSVNDFKDFAVRFSGIDIFIFCYLSSELSEYISRFEETLTLLITRAAPGALLLFIDRDEKPVRETIEQLIKNNPILKFVRKKQERGKLDDDMRDLGEWFINIPSLPRQHWLTFFLLGRKK